MEHTIETEKMNSLKILSETNLKISEAKNALIKLKSEEEAYLSLREKKALDEIDNALKKSEELLQKTQHNYQEVRDLYTTASELSQFVVECYGKFHDLVTEFNKRNELWEKRFKFQNEEIGRLRKQVETDRKAVEGDKKSLDDTRKKMETERTAIESQRSALSTSYAEEKKLWDKISNKN